MVEFHNTSCKRNEEGNLIGLEVVTAGGTRLLFMPEDIEKKVGIPGLIQKSLLDVMTTLAQGSDIREIGRSDFHHVWYRVTKDEAYLYNREGKKVYTFHLGGQ